MKESPNVFKKIILDQIFKMKVGDDAYNIFFKEIFNNFDDRKSFIDFTFNLLKSYFPNLEKYFFKFYVEFISRMEKFSNNLNVDEYISYIQTIYEEWYVLNESNEPSPIQSSSYVSKISKIAEEKGVKISEQNIEEEKKDDKISKKSIASPIGTSKKIIIEKNDGKKVKAEDIKKQIDDVKSGKLNIKPVKAHGDSRIFNHEEFKHRTLSTFDPTEST